MRRWSRRAEYLRSVPPWVTISESSPAPDPAGMLDARPVAGVKPTAAEYLTGDGKLFFELLLLVEAGVVAVEREQLIVAAELDDSTLTEHRDLVCVPHG